MISKVSFLGKVFVTPEVRKLSKQSEISKIRDYADKHDVDVFVYDRTYYVDNAGSYSAVVSKDSKIWHKTFDMKHEDKSLLREIPGQEPNLDDVVGYLEGKYDLKVASEEEVF